MKAAKIGSRFNMINKKWLATVRQNGKQASHTKPIMHNKEALPGRGGGGVHVARLNFKNSHVGVYKCFTSVSEIERKFSIFVGILEKGIVMRCEETITVQFLS